MMKSQFSQWTRWSRPACVGIILGLAGLTGHAAQAAAFPGGEVKDGVQLAAETPQETKGGIEEEAKAAKTPADHGRLAAQFDAQADQLEQVAARHKRLAGIYRAQAGSKDFGQSMASHCERLAKMNSEEAKEMRAMAALHRDLAKASAK